MTDTTVTLPEVKVQDNEVKVELSPEKVKTETPVISADEGIETLKEQVEKAKQDSARRLAEKDRLIADAVKQAHEAQRDLTVVKKDQVSTIIDSLQKDKIAAKTDYRVAMESGDFEKAGDAQDRISEANARIVEAERGKMALEEEVKTPLRQPIQVLNDPVEQMAQTLSPESASWVRAHPEFVRDPKLLKKMVRAHEDAVDEGYRPDSDGYFSFINQELGVSSSRQVETQRRESARSPTSAPVGRDITQSPGAQRPGTVNLSASEVQTALDTLSTVPGYENKTKNELLQIYAQNKLDLISEGKMSRAG